MTQKNILCPLHKHCCVCPPWHESVLPPGSRPVIRFMVSGLSWSLGKPVCHRNKRVYNLWHNLFQVNAEFPAFFSLLSPRIWINQIASETSKDVGRRWPLQMHGDMVFDIGGKSKPGQVAQKARTIQFRCTQRRSLWASPELVKADSGQSHSHSSWPSLIFTLWSLPVTFSLPKRPVGYGLWLVSRMYLLSLSKPGWWNETQNQQRSNPGWPVPRWPW